jgi:hypothetical protein
MSLFLIKHLFLPSIAIYKVHSALLFSLILQLKVKTFQVASDIGMAECMYKRANTKIIVSSYVNGGKPSNEKLGHLIACMQSTGADVIKLVIDVDYITDLAPVFQMLTHCQVFIYGTHNFTTMSQFCNLYTSYCMSLQVVIVTFFSGLWFSFLLSIM